MPSQKEPAHVVPAIEYTVESANWLIAELRAIPPKDPAKRKLDKQRMVSLLAGELIALQQRGYTIEEVAESLRGRGLSLGDRMELERWREECAAMLSQVADG